MTRYQTLAEIIFNIPYWACTHNK